MTCMDKRRYLIAKPEAQEEKPQQEKAKEPRPEPKTKIVKAKITEYWLFRKYRLLTKTEYADTMEVLE
jgi:hypothetical protein